MEINSKCYINYQNDNNIFNNRDLTNTKIEQTANATFVIHTNCLREFNDGTDVLHCYKTSLITKTGQELEIKEFPVDVKEHGKITEVVISNGQHKTAIKTDKTMQERLITYLSTDFAIFRKNLNKNEVDRFGYYPNQLQIFDCQRFSHYLQHGKESDYADSYTEVNSGYRNQILKYYPGFCYSIHAQTANFGKNNEYKTNDQSLHHFVCLAEDVFVSKYGLSEIKFTSYKQILDAYFPKEFTKGSAKLEV